MTLSVCINTCALGPRAAEMRSGQGTGPKYESRILGLRNRILPSLRFDPLVSEIIVAGEWEEGPGYTYVPVPGPDTNVWDQCLQKHEAFQHTTGDLIVFLCDDHIFSDGFSTRLMHGWAKNRLWDVLSPGRTKDGTFIAVGWDEEYIHAHCIIMRRPALGIVSWLDVFNHVRGIWAWDGYATRLWERQGLRIMTDFNLVVEDIESD